MDGDIYFVLIVLSRIHNREKDKDLRFKAQALQNVSPIDFGVDTYLLLNEQAPIVNIARQQTKDYERMKDKIRRKSEMNLTLPKKIGEADGSFEESK